MYSDSLSVASLTNKCRIVNKEFPNVPKIIKARASDDYKHVKLKDIFKGNYFINIFYNAGYLCIKIHYLPDNDSFKKGKVGRRDTGGDRKPIVVKDNRIHISSCGVISGRKFGSEYR